MRRNLLSRLGEIVPLLILAAFELLMGAAGVYGVSGWCQKQSACQCEFSDCLLVSVFLVAVSVVCVWALGYVMVRIWTKERREQTR